MTEDSSQTVYIIVNTINPYGYEINQFLACPNGTKCIVRFKSKWMPTVSNPETLVDKMGVLILRDWETAKLIPLRRLIIKSVLPVGTIFDIEWLALDMIDFDSNPDKQKMQITKFNKHLTTYFGDFKNIAGQDFIDLVFTVNVDFTKEITDSEKPDTNIDVELHNWGKVVDAIGKLNYFIDIDFLKVIGIEDDTKEAQPLVETNELGIKRYELPVEKSFLLTIYQRAFTDKPRGDSSVSPRELILEGDHKAVTLIDAISPVTGKYAGHRFRFKTEMLDRNTDTFLRLETERRDGKILPSIYIPIRLVIPPWRYAMRMLSIPVFIIGAVVLFLSDEWFPNNPSMAKSLSILVMILTSGETQDIIYSSLHRLGSLISNR